MLASNGAERKLSTVAHTKAQSNKSLYAEILFLQLKEKNSLP